MRPRTPLISVRVGLWSWILALALTVGLLGQAQNAYAKPPEEAQVLAKQAFEFYNKGDWTLAITLYRKAFALSRQAEFLFGAARAEQKSGDLESARRDYEFVRDMLPSSDPVYAKTLASLADLAKAAAAKAEAGKVATAPAPLAVVAPPPPAPAKVEPAKMEPPKKESANAEAAKPDAPKSVVVVPPAVAPRPSGPVAEVAAPVAATDGAWKKPAGWTGVAVGGALVVTGVILMGVASSSQTTLNGNKNPDTGHYDPAKITLADAQSQQSGINGKFTAGWVLIGLGAAAGGVGTWFLATAPSAPRLTLAPGGFLVDGRF